jgi:MFS family permease
VVTLHHAPLPGIGRDFHPRISRLQWIPGYTLVISALLILGGSTADRLRRRRVFQTGLALFATGSLLCGLAPSLGLPVAFRAAARLG